VEKDELSTPGLQLVTSLIVLYQTLEKQIEHAQILGSRLLWQLTLEYLGVLCIEFASHHTSST
jgi:hypothetical protein